MVLNLALTDFYLTSAVTAFLILLVSVILSIQLFFSYRKKKSKQTLTLAAIMISLGFVWVAICLNFILNMTGQSYVTKASDYALIIAWTPALGLVGISYLVFSFVKPELLRPVVSVALLITLLYLFLMYVGLPLGLIEAQDVLIVNWSGIAEELPDATGRGVLLIYSFLVIIMLIIAGLMFLFTGLRTEIPLVRTRGLLMGIGFTFFGILVPLDTIVDINIFGRFAAVILLIVVRSFIVISLLLIYTGVTLPKALFPKLERQAS